MTNQAYFGSDIRLPGMPHGKILRSPDAHARIRKIDTAKAETFLNILAMITNSEFSDIPTGDTIQNGAQTIDVRRLNRQVIV